MKSPYLKSTAALYSLLLALAAAPAFPASVLEFSGSGTMETNCLAALSAGCTITASGTATGTNVSDAEFVVRIDTGSPASANGNPVSMPQGVCIPGSFVGRITTASGDTLEFNHVGIVCEEANPGSPIHYNATYRVTSGAGLFAGVSGAGTLSATFTRGSAEQPATALFYLRGNIE